MAKAKRVIQFRKYGDWTKAMQLTKTLDKDLYEAFLRGQEQALKKVAKAVKEHILKQDLPSLYLNPKKRPNGDPRTLIDTRTYVESIKTWRQANEYYVGVKSGIINPRNRKEVAKIAFWLEYGTRRITKRPVWGPTFRELGGTKFLHNITQESINRFLKRRGW